MLKDFKSFIFKGNVMDMAVGVIIGGAFSKIVSSLVSDVFMPLICLITGSVDVTGMKLILKKGALPEEDIVLCYGNFLQNVIDFLLISAVIFLMIKFISNLHKKANELLLKNKLHEEPEPEKEPEPSKEELLLTEIRDLLKQNNV